MVRTLHLSIPPTWHFQTKTKESKILIFLIHLLYLSINFYLTYKIKIHKLNSQDLILQIDDSNNLIIVITTKWELL